MVAPWVWGLGGAMLGNLFGGGSDRNYPSVQGLTAEQVKYNKDLALYQARLNMINQMTPEGSLEYQQIGTAPDGSPRFQAVQRFTPMGARIFDQKNRLGYGMGELARRQLGIMPQVLNQQVGTSGLTPGADMRNLRTYDFTTALNNPQGLTPNPDYQYYTPQQQRQLLTERSFTMPIISEQPLIPSNFEGVGTGTASPDPSYDIGQEIGTVGTEPTPPPAPVVKEPETGNEQRRAEVRGDPPNLEYTPDQMVDAVDRMLEGDFRPFTGDRVTDPIVVPREAGERMAEPYTPAPRNLSPLSPEYRETAEYKDLVDETVRRGLTNYERKQREREQGEREQREREQAREQEQASRSPTTTGGDSFDGIGSYGGGGSGVGGFVSGGDAFGGRSVVGGSPSRSSGSYGGFFDDDPYATAGLTVAQQQRADELAKAGMQGIAPTISPITQYLTPPEALPIQMGLGRQGKIQSEIDRIAPVQMSFGDAGNIPTTYGSPLKTIRQDVERDLFAGIEPIIDRDRNRLINRLTDQGIRIGSEAYSNAMSDFNRGVAEQRRQVRLASGQEMSRLENLARNRATFGLGSQAQRFGQELQRGQFSRAGQQQAYQQALGLGAFGNQAQQQAYQQALGLGAFGNQAQAQQFAQQQARNQSGLQNLLGLGQFNIQAGQATTAQDIARMNMMNQLRAQGLTEQYAMADRPFNQFMAMQGGQQLMRPNFVNTPQTGVETPDLLGFQANREKAQAQTGGDLWQSLGSIGASIAGSNWFGGIGQKQGWW